jgi:3-hydroxybutyryl-CoA dehydrogenase
MTITNVGVIGCGLMGSGIVQVSAQAGFQVLFVEANDELVKRGLGRLRETLEGLASRGKLDTKAKDAALGRIAGTTRLDDLKSCDLVVEAMTENQALKNETFAKLHKICAPHAILASNTSSCNVTAMAAATGRPAQVVGLHFFNPVPLMKLVEVIRALPTSDAAFEQAKGFVERLGKTAVVAKDTPGFVVNRLLVPYLLDAVRIYESGVASKEDIDNGMKLGCGYPMGPLTLLDFVGLDTTYSIANIMFEEFKLPQYAAPPLLKRMVLAGYLGRKSGRGFYDYSKS